MSKINNGNIYFKIAQNISKNKDIKHISNSRNSNPLYKNIYTSKISETNPTENFSLYSQTLASENGTINKTFKKKTSQIENNLNSKVEIKRKRTKQQTVYQPKDNEIIFLYDIIFNSNYSNNIINYNKLRKFIFTYQKKVNFEYSLNIKESNNINDDNERVKKLETLVSRYSIVIYYLVKKNKKEDAKKMFLLLIKENINYIDYHSHKIFKIFNKLLQKYEILKVFPKQTEELFKIYSFIIKYSILFNLTKLKNKFLIRYMALQSLNYRIFKRKNEMRGLSLEGKNQIKYWFAICLHNASYFTINAYCPPRVPIAMSNLILKLYRNLDENLSTKQERSILISTSFNQGILYYVNNQSDQALKALKLTKQKIISFHDNENNGYNNVNKVFQFVDNSNIINAINSNNRINSRTGHKNSLSVLGLNTKELLFNKKIRNHSFVSSNDFVEQIFINEGNRKKSLNMEDISEIFFLNLNIKDDNKLIDFIDDNPFIFKRNRSPLLSLRGSNNEFEKFLKTKEFSIPKYLKEPLFLNIELLMTEINIDKKNYNLAYEHAKNCIILILIIKQLGNLNKNNINKYEKELRILIEFLEIIEKNNKDKKIFSQIKTLKTLKTKLTFRDKKIKKSVKLNNLDLDKNNPIFDKKTKKMENEIEKFFIFLNSLSAYQIKLLNDTQPVNTTRNDLPIFFNNQFKDTLSNTQRMNLEKLNIMSLSRCAILIDPNNYILPSNLQFPTLNKKISNITDKLNENNNTINKNIYISFNGSLMNNNSKEEDNESEKNNFKYNGTEEFENFKKIFFSKFCNNDLKIFLLNNFIYAIEILKKSEKDEIEDMFEYPEILVEPIKLYKKKKKKKIIYLNEYNKEIVYQLMGTPEFKYLLNENIDFSHDNYDKIHNSKKRSLSDSNSYESISNFIKINDINN